MTDQQLRNSIRESEFTPIGICGATASGKTDLSLALAQNLPTEIVCVDSRTVYKLLDVGTAKATRNQQENVPHHLLDLVLPNQIFSAGDFYRKSIKAIYSIQQKKRFPLLVGGTGLYFSTLYEQTFEEPQSTLTKEEARTIVEEKYFSHSAEYALEKLYEIDVESAKLNVERNAARTRRALEYFVRHAHTLSDAQKIFKRDALLNSPIFYINCERQELYNRINVRTKLMWNNGLLDETKSVLQQGYSQASPGLNTVGYKETISYINNEVNESTTIELIAQHTRNYAKRQHTWFSRKAYITPIQGNINQLTSLICKSLET